MARNEIPLLPFWNLTNVNPGFYDLESVTAVEMVAKLYKKMQELIEEYNKYVSESNKIIDSFIQNQDTDFEKLKLAMQQQYDNFIGVIDLRYGEERELFDNFIDNANDQIKNMNESYLSAVNYMKTNVVNTAKGIVEDLFNDGKITITTKYNVETKEVTLSGALEN